VRGDVLICIPVSGTYDHLVQCLQTVIEHTPTKVAILIADNSSPDHNVDVLTPTWDAAGLLDREVCYTSQSEDHGFVANVDKAIDTAKPADVVILNSECVVGEGWLDGLREAAYSDAAVATSSALTNNSTILSVQLRDQPRPSVPERWTRIDEAAAAVATASLKIRPRIPSAIGHCLYIRRSALDLVGNLDPAFSRGPGAEVDFSQRCLLRGLVHVAADDVLILHQGGGSFANDDRLQGTRGHDDEIIEHRYPYYFPTVIAASETKMGPLPRSLQVARRALSGTTLTVDASCLDPGLTGTQLQTLELIRALWETGEMRLRVVVPHNLGRYARVILDEMPGIETLVWSKVKSSTRATDVVHRAYQVTNARDIEVLCQLGERLVITQQDLIAYRNPGYFPDFEGWSRYRWAAVEALAQADRVHFFSKHAANEAVAEDLVDAERARVVYIGVDHHLTSLRPTPRRPAGLNGAGDGEFLLYLGTDFHHKNRVFALQVLDELHRKHGWRGKLVLAGPKVSYGSSASDEAEFVLHHPGIANSVIRLGRISEANKAWLLPRARAVIYPTVHEGFGLVPFEAADAGVPTLCAPGTSLAEVLPPEAAILVPWDVAMAAEQAIELIRDDAARERLVESVISAGKQYTWKAAARGLLDMYREAADAPTRRVGDESVTKVGRLLVGPGGLLPDDVQEALWALSKKPRIGSLVFRSLALIHKVMRRA
jgi:glycosyltransferase involved in cell wall biosynthesis/GT2 family glycosyltransferase